MSGNEETGTRPCRWCEAPVKQRASRWRRARYCTSGHRQKNWAMAAVLTVLDNL